MRRKFEGVFENRGRLYTKALVSGKVYDERIFFEGDVEYREWNLTKSKLAAAIAKDVKVEFGEGSRVLYLGAASGTTVSHVSDIVGPSGIVYAVDFAPRVLRDLMFLAQKRKNIVPILADASKGVSSLIGAVDYVFMDIAQKSQVDIFLKNILVLGKNMPCMIAIKARSIDVTKSPDAVYKKVEVELGAVVKIVDSVKLDPYEKDHKIFLCRS
jgi:fibrillarin-like pre-rRNA processing protein